ncbi:MAG TPA: hypothetical protein GX703_05330 [Erysipelothrix sp.]|jgi:competence protein ComGF|nr:hypothetical protein [Erysipelothrix sp.]
MTNKRGFTLVEMMLGLFFSSMALVLVLNIYLLLMNHSKNIPMIDQNKIGLIQIQNELSVSSDFIFTNNELCYSKFDEEFCLIVDNDRLVKRPGYEIYLIDISEINLTVTDNILHISFKSKGVSISENIKLP